MTIRLEGGYETNDFWREVQRVGNDILKDWGFSDWTVTLRPKTAADVESCSDDIAEEGAARVLTNANTKELIIAGFQEDDFESEEEVVERHICELISNVYDDFTDDDIDDDDDKKLKGHAE